jgi:hypothetical protein
VLVKSMEAFKTYRLEAVENPVLVGPIGVSHWGQSSLLTQNLFIHVGLPKEERLAKGRFCNH